jgi:hypothetical protein
MDEQIMTCAELALKQLERLLRLDLPPEKLKFCTGALVDIRKLME